MSVVGCGASGRSSPTVGVRVMVVEGLAVDESDGLGEQVRLQARRPL